MFRRGLWTKFIFLGTMLYFALFVPAFPSSWAKNPAVKILAEEVRHEQPDEFARGDLENLAVRAEGRSYFKIRFTHQIMNAIRQKAL
jgi:hypothetical protein